MSQNNVRGLAIAIIRRDNEILVVPYYDTKKDEHFYRPLGGGIEFGETSLEALRREFQEEVALELGDHKLLGVIENIYNFDGEPGHEIAFIYEAKFSDNNAYLQEEMTIIDSPTHSAIWLDITKADTSKIYPAGLDKYLL